MAEHFPIDSPPCNIINLALEEDIGSGDITARSFIPQEQLASGQIIAKQDCCLAGINTAREIFSRVDPKLCIECLHQDGDLLKAGKAVLDVAGNASSILAAERTALNFIQHLSGIATLTHRYTTAVAGTKAVILDTRKTTPGMRALEKAAVVAGGGRNHRAGLYDMILVKDNHLATGVTTSHLQEVIHKIKASFPSLKIEIEADTLEQMKVFSQMEGVDIILLDNMPLDSLREAVKTCPSNIKLEASGGITLDTVRGIAETGVDFISVGALTHSAPSMDFSLEFTCAPHGGQEGVSSLR